MLFAHLKRILRLDRLRLHGLSGAKDEFLGRHRTESAAHGEMADAKGISGGVAQEAVASDILTAATETQDMPRPRTPLGGKGLGLFEKASGRLDQLAGATWLVEQRKALQLFFAFAANVPA